MADYSMRVVDAELDELLGGVPALALEGPKGVGKTATSSRRARATYAMDDPLHRTLIEADPDRLDREPTPILLDEWQRLPRVWDLVRGSVDRDATPGRFLLAGSAVPPEVPVHSGAGRIVTVRMRPMSLMERGSAQPSVSLADLLGGRRPDLRGVSGVDLAGYAEEIVASGFPGIRGRAPRARRALLDDYLDRIAQRDVLEQGYAVRRTDAMLAWLRPYAAATATPTSYNRILDAATPGEAEKPARSTSETYRRVLSDLWILDPVPAWSPSDDRLHRLARAPKHHLADPALAARLLGIDAEGLVRGDVRGAAAFHEATLFGRLFESLVTQSVRVYAQANEARVGHLRSRVGGREIDLIVERADGRVVAIETQLSPVVRDDDVKHLRWLHERIGDDLLDALVVTTGTEAYRRPDGIGVVPAAALGP